MVFWVSLRYSRSNLMYVLGVSSFTGQRKTRRAWRIPKEVRRTLSKIMQTAMTTNVKCKSLGLGLALGESYQDRSTKKYNRIVLGSQRSASLRYSSGSSWGRGW